MKVKNISTKAISLCPLDEDGGIVNIRIGAGSVSENPLITENDVKAHVKRGSIEIVTGGAKDASKAEAETAQINALLDGLPEQLTEEVLKAYSKADLKLICKGSGLKGYSKLDETALVDLILGA